MHDFKVQRNKHVKTTTCFLRKETYTWYLWVIKSTQNSSNWTNPDYKEMEVG